jgi:hypothetical protein
MDTSAIAPNALVSKAEGVGRSRTVYWRALAAVYQI